MTTLDVLWMLLWAGLTVPVLIFAVQIFLSLLPYRTKSLPTVARPCLAILVPAHNEQDGILTTLRSIQAQLQAGDELLVIADNCTDRTAEIARKVGASVIERHDTQRRGKSYALEYGVQHLQHDAASIPQVVMIVDADCVLHPGSVDYLARRCVQTQRPVQALYLMNAPRSNGLKARVAEFAWAVKNHARPLGYARLGLPCQLMGTGMAFPWPLLQRLNLANGHIVEDLKLGLDCAAQGSAPLFCPEALVTSVFPANSAGEAAQRTRWEHGHLSILLREAPRLLLKSVCTANLPLFALALDLCIPPLALLTLLVVFFTWLSLAASWLFGAPSFWPLIPGTPLLLGIAVGLAWYRFGRHIISFARLLYAPVYAISKLPLYGRFLLRRQVEWIRSQRDVPGDS